MEKPPSSELPPRGMGTKIPSKMAPLSLLSPSSWERFSSSASSLPSTPSSSAPSSPTTPSSYPFCLLKTVSQKTAIRRSLFSHVPVAILRHLRKQSDMIKNEPFMETFDGVIFFADVSNFSALVAKLGKHKDLDGGSDR